MKTSLSDIAEKILPGFMFRPLNHLLRKGQLARWKRSGRPLPPPQYYKQQVVSQLQRKTGIQVLVETGTYRGDMVNAQRSNFKKIYSVELSEPLYNKAALRFRKQPHIKIINGDSGKVLGQVVAGLKEPAIFWLDGHYSGDETALGESACPVLGELDAIFKVSRQWPILIDDARLFNGTGDFPSLDELIRFIASHAPDMKVNVEDDIVRCIPGK